ncbi:MAG: His/Gly/Thr/Pro-type tRNA ligase C-terminal domain-containing protein, partial [Pseudomonadota bacterium]
SVSEKHNEHVLKIEKELKEHDIRAESDIRNESVGKKIREGRLQRIPYLVVIGDEELSSGNLMVRNRDTQEQKSLGVKEFIKKLHEEEKNRALKLSI